MIWREQSQSEREKMLAQRLRNYKAIQADRAAKMGLSIRLASCHTLTEARKVMRGEIK